MPSYTYICDKCKIKKELFFTLANYKETIKCTCKATMRRSYQDDFTNLSGSVIKADDELKTIGDLANRNRDRMTDDHKSALYEKNNSYKDEVDKKPMPTGMSRIKKPKQKFKWR